MNHKFIILFLFLNHNKTIKNNINLISFCKDFSILNNILLNLI